ncbi:MAG: MlaD family protein, partial [Microvirga sp.]
METRANYALIGLFTLGVIAAGFLFVYWFSGGESGARRQPVRVVFNGSVSGLSKGSVVGFNGLRVGEVTDLRLLPEDPRRVVATIEVDRATPIRTDTRARLEFQGLTGVAQIALVGGEPGSPPLQPGPGQPLPTIFADRSDFQDL